MKRLHFRSRRTIIFLICISFTVTLLIGIKLHWTPEWPKRPLDSSDWKEELPGHFVDSAENIKGKGHFGEKSLIDVVNQAAIQKGKELHEYAKKKAFEKVAGILKVEKHAHSTDSIRNKHIPGSFGRPKRNNNKFSINVLHGVDPDLSAKYTDNNIKFTCLDGKQVFPKEYVNDNYCDCDDGSDEPGTSACPNGRFFCKKEQMFIKSSLVNDGLCDCCDGSDEWRMNKPVGFVLPELPVMSFAPCENFCK